MTEVLNSVARKENFDAEALIEPIIQDAYGNVRKAILILEALRMQKCVPFFIIHIPYLMKHLEL